MTASKTGLAASYQYDPLGRRTRKSGTGVTDTFFLSDGADEIAEYDGTSGALTTRYIPGPAIDEPIAMVDGTTGAKEYFHANHQGSIIAMTGDNGLRVEGPFKYDPYGNCFAGANPCSTGEPYRFTGRRLDPETGLLYYRARYYDPQKGRFLQTDPVGYKADLNLYTYVGAGSIPALALDTGASRQMHLPTRARLDRLSITLYLLRDGFWPSSRRNLNWPVKR